VVRESVITSSRSIDRSIIRRAILDALPLYVPAVPFGLVLGLAITESGINQFVGWSSSWIIFGGAAQLVLISLLGSGAAVAAAISAGLVVNARHLMYSAALAPTFQTQPRWFRWLAPYVLIDQAFALASLRLHDDPKDFRTYYLSIGATFWLLWQPTIFVGMLIGPVVPTDWNLGFAVPILFLGLIVIAIDKYPKLVAGVVGAGVTWLTAGLPNRAGLLVGALVGILAGTIAERFRQ
jgi:4-azaleucine resistance transporter AzlC